MFFFFFFLLLFLSPCRRRLHDKFVFFFLSIQKDKKINKEGKNEGKKKAQMNYPKPIPPFAVCTFFSSLFSFLPPLPQTKQKKIKKK